MPGTIERLWPQVAAAFAGVDCILHAGDLHVADVIDELECIAPTYVSVGNGDLDVRHDRLRDTWVGRLAGCNVGLIHRFPTPRRASGEKLARKMQQQFGSDNLQVIVYGHTHLAEVHSVDGCTYINPGSATLPNNQSTRLGTLGLLTLSTQKIEVELMQIVDSGLQLITHHTGVSNTTKP